MYTALYSLCVAYIHQSARSETCTIRFTTKWTSQYKRPQYTTEIQLNIHCSVFTVVFIRIPSVVHRRCTPITCTLSLSTQSSGQGGHPLLLSQCAPSTGATPVFSALPPLHFTDSLQTSRLLKEDMQDGVTICLCEGKHSLCLVGCCSRLA